MAEIQCRHFNGYKPCGKGTDCERSACRSYESVGTRVLIIHLEALGAVLRSTALLKAVRREFSRPQITWVTKAPAADLLQNLHRVDRVLSISPEDLLKLSALEFDVALVIDKSLAAAGVLKIPAVREVRGFRADPVHGAIVPANPEAFELWQLGLDNRRKFFGNEKSEQHLVHEALRLGPYTRDSYEVRLSEAELELAHARRRTWAPEGGIVIGINTGCSATLPAKRLSIEGHRRLITRIVGDPLWRGSSSVVLLGGPQDSERNERIAQDLPVVLSPTHKGLRDGLASVAACDLVFSGDSLGMHMAIGLGKWVVAWFGPTCAQEIDLYGRGVKIRTRAACSPCWKRVCREPVMCYDQIDFDHVLAALAQGRTWLTSYSKPHFPEISSSPSPY